MKYLKIKSNKGFSLIELMVAVSIFAIVMTISMGAVLSIVNGNRKNQSLSVAMNNLNYAVENMTRMMKTGQDFVTSGGSCDGSMGGSLGTTGISFLPTEGNNRVAYSLGYVGGKGRLFYYRDADSGSSGEAVTAPEITITSLCFTLLSNPPVNTVQPAVRISIAGVVTGRDGTSSDFSISTSVTQRSVNY